MVSKNHEIISKILSMGDQELSEFMAGLKPETLDYLELILGRVQADDRLPQLKKHLDTK